MGGLGVRVSRDLVLWTVLSKKGKRGETLLAFIIGQSKDPR